MGKEFIMICLLVLGMFSFVRAEEEKMKIEMTTLEYNSSKKLILTATQPVRRFRLAREARLCEGTYLTIDGNFYLESPGPGSAPNPFEKYYVSKAEYNKNPKIILNEEGRPVKDVFHKILSKGTEFELISVKLNAGAMSENYYWIRLVGDAEYSDKLIDAVALTSVDDGYRWSYWWSSFIDYTPNKEKIKVKKVPMFKRKWAREVKDK